MRISTICFAFASVMAVAAVPLERVTREVIPVEELMSREYIDDLFERDNAPLQNTPAQPSKAAGRVRKAVPFVLTSIRAAHTGRKIMGLIKAHKKKKELKEAKKEEESKAADNKASSPASKKRELMMDEIYEIIERELEDDFEI